MATIYTDNTYISEALKYELEPSFCRDSITIASGVGILDRNTVLGKVTATGKWKILAPGASDGTQTAAGILLAPVDATSADVTAIALTRGPAIINPDGCVWPVGITTNQKATAVANLLTIDIKAGTGV